MQGADTSTCIIVPNQRHQIATSIRTFMKFMASINGGYLGGGRYWTRGRRGWIWTLVSADRFSSHSSSEREKNNKDEQASFDNSGYASHQQYHRFSHHQPPCTATRSSLLLALFPPWTGISPLPGPAGAVHPGKW